MTHVYDQTTRAAVRKRMSPPNRESVAQIARDTGITEQTLYNWRRSWQQQGDRGPATAVQPGAPSQSRAAAKKKAKKKAKACQGPPTARWSRSTGWS